MDKENQIIASIYDAALDPCTWKGVIQDIVTYTHSKAAIFTALDQFNPAFNFLYSHNIPEQGLQAYQDERIKAIDMSLHMHLWNAIELGDVVVQNRTHYADNPNTDEYVFYEKCLKPSGVSYLAGILLERREYRWAVFAIHRAVADGHFSQTELGFLKRISIHFRRALQIQKQLSLLEMEKMNAYQALNALKIGVILLDHRQEIKFSNALAQKLLTKNLEIKIDTFNQLKFGKHYQIQFNQLIQNSLQQQAQDIQSIGGVMSIQDEAGHHLMLTLAPFQSSHEQSNHNRTKEIVIYMTDQYQQHAISKQYLQQQYQLTNREVSLCEYLVNGFKPEEIAEQSQLSIHSIRTYMKSIYEKVGVNSQIELMHILNNCTLPFQHIA